MSTSPDFRDGPPEGNAQLSKRERGKLAQREYRKRHASRFQTLKDENSKLKKAIRRIRHAASREQNLGQDLLDIILGAAEEAGFGDAGQSQDDGDAVLEQALVPASITESSETWIASAPVNDGNATTTLHLQHVQPSFTLSPTVWLNEDRLVRSYDAPADVMPFLGENLLTFSGCLYWACTYYAVSIWRTIKNLPQPSFSCRSRLDRLVNHARHLNDHEFLLSLAQARIDFREKGFVHGLYEAGYFLETEPLADCKNMVRREYKEQDDCRKWWRGPHEVESYIRPLLTVDENAQLEEVVQGRGSTRNVDMYGPLFEGLAKSFVCFGDGPRWHIIHLSLMVGGWLKGRPSVAGPVGEVMVPSVENMGV